MIIKYYNGLSLHQELKHKEINIDDVISWKINRKGFFKHLKPPNEGSLFISFKDGTYLHEPKSNIINYKEVINFIQKVK